MDSSAAPRRRRRVDEDEKFDTIMANHEGRSNDHSKRRSRSRGKGKELVTYSIDTTGPPYNRPSDMSAPRQRDRTAEKVLPSRPINLDDDDDDDDYHHDLNSPIGSPVTPDFLAKMDIKEE
ncbi:hypothetical protein SARC_01475 [Sphaeroforma arctica JP610]|uniref:Uncharacterized protein n=1 Tax=Sphaeroforma arctica JP610 TaxID=667725 RepID=A0A0L0GBK0_9EUKA|nr:hypothetical protein SARC_01475 [Sphaeroforma arctica JP610]KNC86380.1 hypothetical protein SARC_01475 [Sphaeroforma arctica JP610]|eukprot:XP_014160282.1 hypothetical protein SARC_01475 [Sphaeroforma arctica JP610]